MLTVSPGLLEQVERKGVLLVGTTWYFWSLAFICVFTVWHISEMCDSSDSNTGCGSLEEHFLHRWIATPYGMRCTRPGQPAWL